MRSKELNGLNFEIMALKRNPNEKDLIIIVTTNGSHAVFYLCFLPLKLYIASKKCLKYFLTDVFTKHKIEYFVLVSLKLHICNVKSRNQFLEKSVKKKCITSIAAHIAMVWQCSLFSAV